MEYIMINIIKSGYFNKHFTGFRDNKKVKQQAIEFKQQIDDNQNG